MSGDQTLLSVNVQNVNEIRDQAKSLKLSSSSVGEVNAFLEVGDKIVEDFELVSHPTWSIFVDETKLAHFPLGQMDRTPSRMRVLQNSSLVVKLNDKECFKTLVDIVDDTSNGPIALAIGR